MELSKPQFINLYNGNYDKISDENFRSLKNFLWEYTGEEHLGVLTQCLVNYTCGEGQGVTKRYRLPITSSCVCVVVLLREVRNHMPPGFCLVIKKSESPPFIQVQTTASVS